VAKLVCANPSGTGINTHDPPGPSLSTVCAPRRSACTRITASDTSGRSRIMLSNSRCPIRRVRTSPSATSEAILGVRVMIDTPRPGRRALDEQPGTLRLRIRARHGPCHRSRGRARPRPPLARDDVTVSVRAFLGDRRNALQVRRRELSEQRDLAQGQAPQSARPPSRPREPTPQSPRRKPGSPTLGCGSTGTGCACGKRRFHAGAARTRSTDGKSDDHPARNA
jgi:hypothetical protein